MKGKTLTIDLTEKEMDALKIIIEELVPDSPNMSEIQKLNIALLLAQNILEGRDPIHGKNSFNLPHSLMEITTIVEPKPVEPVEPEESKNNINAKVYVLPNPTMTKQSKN